MKLVFLLAVLAFLEAVNCRPQPPIPSSVLNFVRSRPATPKPHLNYFTTSQQASKGKSVIGEILKVVDCILPKIIHRKDEVYIEALDIRKIFSAIMKCSSSPSYLLEKLRKEETSSVSVMRELTQELEDMEVKEAVDQEIVREQFLHSFPVVRSNFLVEQLESD